MNLCDLPPWFSPQCTALLACCLLCNLQFSMNDGNYLLMTSLGRWHSNEGPAVRSVETILTQPPGLKYSCTQANSEPSKQKRRKCSCAYIRWLKIDSIEKEYWLAALETQDLAIYTHIKLQKNVLLINFFLVRKPSITLNISSSLSQRSSIRCLWF